jgi:hypothetical protein
MRNATACTIERKRELGGAEADQETAPRVGNGFPKQSTGGKRDAGSRPIEAKEAPQANAEPRKTPSRERPRTPPPFPHIDLTPPSTGTASLALDPTPIKQAMPISAHKAIT